MNVAAVLTRGESGLSVVAQFFDTLDGYRRYLAAFLAGACAALALALRGGTGFLGVRARSPRFGVHLGLSGMFGQEVLVQGAVVVEVVTPR